MRQCVNGAPFILTWRGFIMEVVGNSSGQVEVAWEGVKLDAPYEVKDPKGASVRIRVADRQRTYQLGEQILLNPHDLNEICFMYLHQAEELVKGAEAFGHTRGVLTKANQQQPSIPTGTER